MQLILRSMKSINQKTILVLDVLIVVLVLVSWMLMVFRLANNGTLSAGGLNNLKYFTLQSNLLAAAASVLSIIYAIRNAGRPSWIIYLKYVSAAAVGLTFVVVIAFLGPIYGYPGMYRGANLGFHLIVPLLAMAGFVLEDTGKISFKSSLLALIPVILYAVYYVVNILLKGISVWPDTNDWYFFLAWGWGTGVLILIAILIVTWGLALLLRAAHNKHLGVKNGRQ